MGKVFRYGICDAIVNRKFKMLSTVPNAVLIMGEQGSGKSTLLSFLNCVYKGMGYKTLSNYPMENTFQIPLVDRKNPDGSVTKIIDKTWLYNAKLNHCVVFLDEAADIWAARKFASWTFADGNFFTKLRKNDIILILVTQYYDLIDINCKRACQHTWFLTQHNWFRNVSFVRVSSLLTAPIADSNRYIAIKGKYKVAPIQYDLCEDFIGTFRFYRKPYYKYFITEFDFNTKIEVNWESMPTWNNVFNIPEPSYN